MREIKFRAWGEKTNQMFSHEEMCDGDFDSWPTLYFAITGDNDGYIPMYFAITGDNDGYIPMQYTGLKDKNGVEIYEGDLLMFNDEGYTEFGWGKAIGEVVWVDCSFEVSMRQPKSETFWDLEDNESWEVIGNIYENPELLK